MLPFVAATRLRHHAIDSCVLYSVDERKEVVLTMRDCGFSSTGFVQHMLCTNQVEEPASTELVFCLKWHIELHAIVITIVKILYCDCKRVTCYASRRATKVYTLREPSCNQLPRASGNAHCYISLYSHQRL